MNKEQSVRTRSDNSYILSGILMKASEMAKKEEKKIPIRSETPKNVDERLLLIAEHERERAEKGYLSVEQFADLLDQEIEEMRSALETISDDLPNMAEYEKWTSEEMQKELDILKKWRDIVAGRTII